MNTILFPIEPEFTTVEETEAYDQWFRTRVRESLDDSRPNITHGQVMADMECIIRAAEERRVMVQL